MKINNKNDYKKIIDELKRLSDKKYLEFNSSIIPTNDIMYGVRTPILKQISKKIANSDYEKFIKYNSHKSYEEKLLHGLVIGYINADFNEILRQIDIFMPFNDNWAINDIVCANLKVFKNNKKEGYKKIKEYLNSNNPWKIRFGLVLLLNYYIDDEYIDLIIDNIVLIKNDNYYVKMANAWLISICFKKYKKKIYNLLKLKTLDKYTQNKAIQKIRESYEISKFDKLEVLTYKC